MNYETKNRKYIVIYGGRFQPPHVGHYYTIQYIKNIFHRIYKNNFVLHVTSSNKQGPESPFSFEEKKFLWKKLYDIDLEYSKIPAFKAHEILKKYDNEKDICIYVTSEKDDERYKKSRYYKKFSFDEKEHIPFKDICYYLVTPVMAHGISATFIRNIMKINDETEKYTKWKTFYNNPGKEIYKYMNECINNYK